MSVRSLGFLALLVVPVSCGNCLDEGTDCCINIYAEDFPSCEGGYRPSVLLNYPTNTDTCPNYDCDLLYADMEGYTAGKCADSGRDCYANQNADPSQDAACDSGYHPTHQPQEWDDAPNFACLQDPGYFVGIPSHADNSCDAGVPVLTEDDCERLAEDLQYKYHGRLKQVADDVPDGCMLFFGPASHPEHWIVNRHGLWWVWKDTDFSPNPIFEDGVGKNYHRKMCTYPDPPALPPPALPPNAPPPEDDINTFVIIAPIIGVLFVVSLAYVQHARIQKNKKQAKQTAPPAALEAVAQVA